MHVAGLLRRCPGVVVAMGVLSAPAAQTATAGPTRTNEIRISQPGADADEFFELAGDPGGSLAGLSVVVLSREFGPGQIDFTLNLAGLTFN